MNFVTMFYGFNRAVKNAPLDEVMKCVWDGTYKAPIEEIRALVAQGKEEEAQKLKKLLPAFTVSAIYQGGRRVEHFVEYQCEQMLDFDNLKGEELARVRALVDADEHTKYSFLSPMHGLKVVVEVTPPKDFSLRKYTFVKDFHKKIFKEVSEYYEKLTGVEVDKSGSDISRITFVSFDPNLYTNPKAVPFALTNNDYDPEEGKNGQKKWELVFKRAYQIVASQKEYNEGNRNNFVFLVSNLLNRYGMPRDVASPLLTNAFPDLPPQEMETTINSAYSHVDEHGVAGARKRKVVLELASQYINERYELHYNLVSTQVEICKKEEGDKAEFQNLTDRKVAIIWRRMNGENIDISHADLELLLLSDLSEDFNPFTSYYESLPTWDGNDYIKELANTLDVKENQEQWQFYFSKWLVAMVASHINTNITNHLMIILCGKQGYGKSRWCELILPPALRRYYANASVKDNDKDFLLKLCYRALVNIEELDVLTQQENARLKRNITQDSVQQRRAYAHYEQDYIRYASLIGSSNNQLMLSDPTGSRRYVPFTTEKINYEHTTNYDQLYAQVMHLLHTGYRYWLNIAEIEELTLHNQNYQFLSPEEEFLLTYFTREPIHNQPSLLTASDILKRVNFRTGLPFTSAGVMMMGKILHNSGFITVRKKRGTFYKVYEIGEDEVERRRKIKENNNKNLFSSDSE